MDSEKMSDVGPGTLIKLAYRGVAGFFVLLFLFIFGVLGFAFSLAGGLATVLCWVPIAFPELLDYTYAVDNVNYFTTSPELASLALLVVGIIFLMLGFFFLFITFVIGKGSIVIDRELSTMVDRTFTTSGNNRIFQLERLTALLEKGVLTRDEFEEEKAILLGNQPQIHKGDYIK
jgi:hypothetical protein